MEVLNVQSQVNYPVPDKKTGQAYESRTVESHMEADESGFAFIALICLTVSRSHLYFTV